MELTNKFTLIEGEFNIAEGKSIVLSFINTKILFHNHQLIKISEGGEGDVVAIDKKIMELKKSRKDVIDLLSENTAENQKIEIEGIISIKKL